MISFINQFIGRRDTLEWSSYSHSWPPFFRTLALIFYSGRPRDVYWFMSHVHLLIQHQGRTNIYPNLINKYKGKKSFPNPPGTISFRSACGARGMLMSFHGGLLRKSLQFLAAGIRVARELLIVSWHILTVLFGFFTIWTTRRALVITSHILNNPQREARRDLSRFCFREIAWLWKNYRDGRASVSFRLIHWYVSSESIKARLVAIWS